MTEKLEYNLDNIDEGVITEMLGGFYVDYAKNVDFLNSYDVVYFHSDKEKQKSLKDNKKTAEDNLKILDVKISFIKELLGQKKTTNEKSAD